MGVFTCTRFLFLIGSSELAVLIILSTGFFPSALVFGFERTLCKKAVTLIFFCLNFKLALLASFIDRSIIGSCKNVGFGKGAIE